MCIEVIWNGKIEKTGKKERQDGVSSSEGQNKLFQISQLHLAILSATYWQGKSMYVLGLVEAGAVTRLCDEGIE